MFTTKPTIIGAFSVIAVTGWMLLSVPAITRAQGLPGLTIFSGVDHKDQLSFKLDYGTPDIWDRYQLRIPAKKLPSGVSQIEIEYPDYYKGTFDTKKVQVLANEKPLPLQKVDWDQKAHKIEIFLKDPLMESKSLNVVLDNVKNPDFGGMYYFNCNVVSISGVPTPVYAGTWIVEIGR